MKFIKEVSFFSRPYRVLYFNNKFDNILIRTLNDEKNIYLFKYKKKGVVTKKIKTQFKKSFLKIFKKKLIIELDENAKGINLYNLNGEKLQTFRLSIKKIKIKIESILIEDANHKLIILDSNNNSQIHIKFLKKSLEIKIIYFDKKDINFENSIIEKIDKSRFIFSNLKNNLFLLNNDFKIIKKLSKNKINTGPYYFRLIKSIIVTNEYIIICDYLDHKIKFYNKKFKFLFFLGGKGKNTDQLDLPNDLDITIDNQLLVSDSQNDRILLLSSKRKSRILIKPKFIKKNLRRPIKILENSNKFFVLDRDNSRIVIYNFNLRFKDDIQLPVFKEGKPNSFVIFSNNKINKFIILYRFSNLSNKIIIVNSENEVEKTINLDLNDAQDLDILEDNIVIADTNNRRLVIYNLNNRSKSFINLTKFTNNPRLLTKSVCVDENEFIYTSDFDKCIVLKFDLKFNLKDIFDFRSKKNYLKVIRSVKVNKNLMFLLNRSEQPILLFDLKKKKFLKLKKTRIIKSLHNPTSIFLQKKNLFVADKENDRVLKISNII